MQEKCLCQTDVHACCACVSMHCSECHKPQRSKFIQGRFCSNCGRPLKAELTRLYVPKSEVEELKKAYAIYEETTGLKQAKQEVAREIFEEIEKFLEVALMNGHIETPILCIGFNTFFELKKKYTEEE